MRLLNGVRFRPPSQPQTASLQLYAIFSHMGCVPPPMWAERHQRRCQSPHMRMGDINAVVSDNNVVVSRRTCEKGSINAVVSLLTCEKRRINTVASLRTCEAEGINVVVTRRTCEKGSIHVVVIVRTCEPGLRT